ncbi:MAG: hypothetical protein Q8Q09_16590 [Deltaproteobacteria bacterium]|nr:hypothetical protein [Deltaproteobacteria bacterium]
MKHASWWFVAAAMLFLYALRAEAVFTQDTFYSLRMGQETVASWTSQGLAAGPLEHTDAWVHVQWLAHLALFAVFQLMGLKGVLFVRALLSSWAVASVATQGAKDDPHSLRLAVWGLIAIAVISPFLAVRAQSLAEPLFVAVLLLSRRKVSPGQLAQIGVLGALWANVHGSVVLISAILFVALVGRWKDHSRNSRAMLFVAAVGSLALPLLTPFGLRGIVHYQATALSPLVRASVEEWASATIAETPVFFAAVLLLAAVAFRARVWRWDLSSLMLCAGLAGVASRSLRHELWFALCFASVGPTWLPRALAPETLAFVATRDPMPVARALVAVSVLALGVAGARAESRLSHDGVQAQARWLADQPQGVSLHADLWLTERGRMAEPTRLAARLSRDVRMERWTPMDFECAGQMRGWRALRSGICTADLIWVDAARGRPSQAALHEAGWEIVREAPAGRALVLRRRAIRVPQ